MANTFLAGFVIVEKHSMAEGVPRSVLAFGCDATLNVKMDKRLSRNQTDNADTVFALAESGDPEAQFEVGLAFASSGDRFDPTEAARWYLKAAEQSHARAQYNLGLMYLKGQGVPRDKALSRSWMSKAANLGDAAAQYEFGMREHRLSMDEKSEVALELKIEAYKWLLLAAAQGYCDSAMGCDFVAMDLTHAAVIEGKRRASAFKSSTI
jgi:TPR repeat protein